MQLSLPACLSIPYWLKTLKQKTQKNKNWYELSPVCDYCLSGKSISSWKGQRSTSPNVKNLEIATYLTYLFTYGCQIKHQQLRLISTAFYRALIGWITSATLWQRAGDSWTFTSFMPKMGSRTLAPFYWIWKHIDVIQGYTNLLEFLICLGHLHPHICIVWWACQNNNKNRLKTVAHVIHRLCC